MLIFDSIDFDNSDKSINLFKELKDSKFVTSFIEELILDGKEEKDIMLAISSLESLEPKHKWEYPRKVLIPKDDVGKFREVFIFSDKDSLILKAINKVFNAKLGNLIFKNVFSYKKGVSVYTACNFLKQEIKSHSLDDNTVNYIKADISKYFNSVNIKSIINAINSLVCDDEGRELLMNLYSINMYKDKDGILHKEYLGIMPGTALSSFMANYLLRDIDKLLYSMVGVYVRYSDDIVLVDRDVENLKSALNKLSDSLEAFGLKLNEKKVDLFEHAEFIEFLGLKLNRFHIDISKKNFNKLKSMVKSICKSVRKQYELDLKKKKNIHIINYLELAISKVNKTLYGGYRVQDGLSRNSKLTYLFKNITTIETLYQFDLYVADCLRWVYTGVHNKANYKKVSSDLLKNLNYVPSVDLYNVGKVGKDVLDFRINKLLNKEPFMFKTTYTLNKAAITKISLTEEMSFLAFTTICKQKGFKLFLEGLIFEVEDLEVDFINKEIKLSNKTLVCEDKFVYIGEFGALKDGLFVKFIPSSSLSIERLCNKKVLLNYYRNTYVNGHLTNELAKYNPYKYPSKIDRKDFAMAGFKQIRDFISPSLFALTFYCYLYTCPNSFKEREYVILGESVPLVFESKLIQNNHN